VQGNVMFALKGYFEQEAESGGCSEGLGFDRVHANLLQKIAPR
jgi:hypothetical protein